MDSTATGCGAKAALYADFGIREYWLVDLTKSEVVVHRKPEEAAYTTIFRVRGADSLQSEILPDVNFPVEAIFA